MPHIPPLLLTSLLLLAPINALQIPFFSPTSSPLPSSASPNRPADEGGRTFTLRHAFHSSTSHRHLPPSRLDYSTQDVLSIEGALSPYGNTQTVRKTKRLRVQRPSSQDAFHAARRSSFMKSMMRSSSRLDFTSLAQSQFEDERLASTLEWEETEIEVPDTNDVETLAAFGRMTSNAYTTPDQSGWYDIGAGWNRSDSFGWKEHGIRGHVFADEKNETIVVSIKGTSAFIVGGGTDTSKNDKINDNLLFSCCCARVDWSWSTVCDCYDSPGVCKQDCLEHAVMTKSAYYPTAIDLYNNISAIYPDSQIWLSGHSLGGGLAAMLSRTYGVPSISFESPGDLLPSRRLHLPLPPPPSNSSSNSSVSKQPTRSLQDELTTHIFHTADPIPMGVCTGTISTCAIGGFALESRCHTGKTILYDTVGRLGWSVDIRTHPIHIIIDYLLKDDWGVKQRNLGQDGKKRSWLLGWWPGKGNKDKDGEGGDDGNDEEDEEDGQRKGRGVPEPRFEEDDCEDCFRWNFVDG
ncbi:triglyceride lipase ATG15 [Sporobolomyces salmoneus]|uniref:triglyceride lipase ATG15 n=1 Tax=Sporobolomyces salmoneus TaxID=183962 RepID=UPI0031814018